ncbi:pif-6 [Matsumuraeses phaseoli granulovirus]|uniref:Pif-6 n=1 Tax=Matsumuraeses phaseoli granulovirus TaxID=2760664 RepID=A0AAE7MLG8_9BBAC|nr:pif-6 [Matsumuraeses phaseoli granulovirus]QOD40066.1 pif-6 [Matsumuraeses phaseoli granulovirus]
MREVSEGLLDILQKYNWQIVDRQYIEVIPNERENAWKDIIILILKSTPQSYRKGIRAGVLEHFDFKQPIVYDLKRKQINLENLSALRPPQYAAFNSKWMSPLALVTGFILVSLSYFILERSAYYQ